VVSTLFDANAAGDARQRAKVNDNAEAVINRLIGSS
jgi:hypothetical protein